MKEREIALYAIIDILNDKAYNNIILRKTLSKNKHLSIVQRAFITELVNGTLRNMINIDYIISIYSKTPLKKMKPLILNNIRISVYQIMYMDKVPDSAACNEAVELCKKRGFGTLGGFINGVLRNIARNKNNIKYPDFKEKPLEFLSVKYSYPLWILEYWQQEFSVEDMEKICISNRKPPMVSACVNTVYFKIDDVKRTLSEEDCIAVTDGIFEKNSVVLSKTSDITETKAFKNGMFHIMDESSMLSVDILDPKQGATVMDICSAPGGKTFYCAYKMKNKGKIISRDIYGHKLDLINEGINRLRLTAIKTQLFDAEKVDENYIGAADYVLVDAPCSGLGLARKKPDIKYNKTMEDIESLAELQRRILAAAAGYVKTGGILVYSTCTISKKENLDNAKWFSQNFDFEFEDITPCLPEKISCATAKNGYIQILPGDYGTDGFFIAKFKRK